MRTLFIVAVAIALCLYGLHRLALWAERRGWLYYKNKKRPPGVGLGLLAPIYNPALQHVIEEGQSQRVRGEQDESGADPNRIDLDGPPDG